MATTKEMKVAKHRDPGAFTIKRVMKGDRIQKMVIGGVVSLRAESNGLVFESEECTFFVSGDELKAQLEQLGYAVHG